MLTALVGSALPGPGSSIRRDLGQDQRCAADRHSDDGATPRAGEAAGSLPFLCRGRINAMQRDPDSVVKDATRKPLDTHEWREGHCQVRMKP